MASDTPFQGRLVATAGEHTRECQEKWHQMQRVRIYTFDFKKGKHSTKITLVLMSKLTELLQAERNMLRNELLELKNCQVRYFSLSVAATGVLISLGIKLGSQSSPSSFYLAPLVIILPCWWIFFDKATTITRIVGYCRLLERMMVSILSPSHEAHEAYRYIGWENALGLNRKKQIDEKPSKFLSHYANLTKKYTKALWMGISRGLTLKTTHRYWVVNWYTFFILSVLCWILGSGVWEADNIVQRLSSVKVVLSGIGILSSCVHNLYLLGSLTHGKYSYDSNEDFWKRILSV